MVCFLCNLPVYIASAVPEFFRIEVNARDGLHVVDFVWRLDRQKRKFVVKQ
jgi:hypothetical protein